MVNGRFAVAAGGGAVIGVGSVATTPAGRDALARTAGEIGGAAEVRRPRLSQPGDRWPGCDEARAAGAAPIYRGEPDHRLEMDGDDDGIACEPHRDD